MSDGENAAIRHPSGFATITSFPIVAGVLAAMLAEWGGVAPATTYIPHLLGLTLFWLVVVYVYRWWFYAE